MDTSFISKIAVGLMILQPLFCFACKPEQKNMEVPSTLSNNIIHKVTKEHFFSSFETKDKFQIQLTGKDILSGQVKFEITAKDKLIYSIVFNSMDLIGYGLESNASRKQKEEFIITRMEEFFDEKKFINPAIDSKDYDPEDFDLINISVWTEIKKGRSIGFYYVIGEENMTWIVFLRKENKVIKYKTCC